MADAEAKQARESRGPQPEGILVVDKAPGMTSHDVVGVARRALQTRAIGHAGTLDPMATGVLVLAVGDATRLLHYLTLDDKRYLATVCLGVGTDTLDADGQVTERAPLPEGLDAGVVAAAASQFVGPLRQRAPVISAIKRDGEPLYRKARRGEQVEAPVRDVVVHGLQILAVRPNAIDLDVRCGKGFYVRALARDLAHALGTVGHLTALRRTESGPYGLDQAVGCARLQAARSDAKVREDLRRAMLTSAQAASGLARVTVTPAGEADLRHGRRMPLSAIVSTDAPTPGPAPIAALSEEGLLIAIVRMEPEYLRVLRGFPSRG